MRGGMRPEPHPDGTWTIHIDRDWPGFAGHFPDDALVPAGLVIDWALSIIGPEKTLERARFTAPLRPGDRAVMTRTGLRIDCHCESRMVAVLHFSDTPTLSVPPPPH